MSSKVKVEKFVSGQLDNSFVVPLFFLNLISQLLPESGTVELKERGIDLQAIRNAVENGETYSSSINVKGGDVDKTVVISVA